MSWKRLVLMPTPQIQISGVSSVLRHIKALPMTWACQPSFLIRSITLPRPRPKGRGVNLSQGIQYGNSLTVLRLGFVKGITEKRHSLQHIHESSRVEKKNAQARPSIELRKASDSPYSMLQNLVPAFSISRRDSRFVGIIKEQR